MTVQAAEAQANQTQERVGAMLEERMSSILLTSLSEVFKKPEGEVRRKIVMQAHSLLDKGFRDVAMARGALLASIGATTGYENSEALDADLTASLEAALNQVRTASDLLEDAKAAIDGFRERAAEHVKTTMPEVYAKVKAEQEAAKNSPCNCINCKITRSMGVEVSVEIHQVSAGKDDQADQARQADQASQANQDAQGCQGCGKCEKAAAATTETETAA